MAVTDLETRCHDMNGGRLILSLRACTFAIVCAALLACATPSGYQGNKTQKPGQTIENVQVMDRELGRVIRLRLHVPGERKAAWPMVVFSHGARCSPVNYDAITRYWAARGYAVIVPYHRDALENQEQLSAADIPKLFSARVRDLSSLLDSLDVIEDQAQIKGQLDRGRIAIAGHSFGGMMAMVKSGLRIKPEAYLYGGAVKDPRYSAAIVMSGVGPMPEMTGDAFAGLQGPLLATGGTLDEGNIGSGTIYPWQWRMSAYDLAPARDKYRVVLDRGDHYLGGLICRGDRGGPPDEKGLAIIQFMTTVFLDAYLSEDVAARDYLQQLDLSAMTGGRASYQRK